MLLTPESKNYDSARQLFNARFNLHPAFIARCNGEQDIATAVKAANARGLQVTVKSGGHSFEGFSSNNDGFSADHNSLSFPHQGLDQKLTGVEPARVVKEIIT